MDTVFTPGIENNKLQILNHYSFYTDASTSTKADILSHSRLVSIKPGNSYFQPGDQIRQLALIGTGSVRVYMVNESGREITLYHLHAGGACPISILSILLDRPAPAFAVVETSISAIVIDHADFKRWTAEHACIRKYVFESLATRLNEVLSLVEDFKFRKLEKRLAEYLINQLPSTEAHTPTIRITHMQIASELGSAREVISRLLREFERQDAVQLARGKIVVSNKRALKQILEA